MPNRGENGVLVVLDYLWHDDGMRLPRERMVQAIDVWKAQADIADEAVALKAGGTEPRYRLSGGYQLTAPPKQVLPLMLMPMDARLYLRGDGAIVIDIGKFVTPTVALTDDHIVDYSAMMRGRDAADLRNKITAKFVAAPYLYVEQEADPWLDQANIDLNGELSIELDMPWCPSHAQTRRRMKIEAYRQNPEWSGQIITNAYGLRAIDQRFIRVQVDELGLDEVFEILRWQFDVMSGNCTFDISAMPAEAYAWDATLEEGTAPAADDAPAPVDVEDVENFDVTDDGTVLQAIVDAPVQPSLVVEFDWRIHDGGVTDDDAVWTPFTIIDGFWSGYSEALDPDDYDIRARFVPPSGPPGAYSFIRSYTLP